MRIWITQFYYHTNRIYTTEVEDFKPHYCSILVKNPRGVPHQFIPAESCFTSKEAALSHLKRSLEQDVSKTEESIRKASTNPLALLHGGAEETRRRKRWYINLLYRLGSQDESLVADFWSISPRYLER